MAALTWGQTSLDLCCRGAGLACRGRGRTWCDSKISGSPEKKSSSQEFLEVTRGRLEPIETELFLGPH